MAIDSAEIVKRLCRAAAREHFPLGAVRVQKLIYLIECEYFRWNQTRLTSEEWVYFHYGPWSPTLDVLLKSQFQITDEVTPDGRIFHQFRYDENEFQRLPERFNDFEIQGIFEHVVDRWLVRPLADLLDYVYFHTAPMVDAVRREALDFARIADARKEPKVIDVFALAGRDRRRSDAIKQSLAAWRKTATISSSPALPWDAAAVEATQALDAAEETPVVIGEITISSEVGNRDGVE